MTRSPEPRNDMADNFLSLSKNSKSMLWKNIHVVTNRYSNSINSITFKNSIDRCKFYKSICEGNAQAPHQAKGLMTGACVIMWYTVRVYDESSCKKYGLYHFYLHDKILLKKKNLFQINHYLIRYRYTLV